MKIKLPGKNNARAWQALANKHRWQPFDTAPTDGTEIDISAVDRNGVRRRLIDCSYKNGKWVGTLQLINGPHSPTHWMPIPSHPA